MIRPSIALDWMLWMPATAALAVFLLGLGAIAAAEDTDALSARGRAVFFAQGCHGCHTLGEVGTPISADLSRVRNGLSRAELEGWLRDPVAQKPTAHMPKLSLTEDEVRAIADL